MQSSSLRAAIRRMASFAERDATWNRLLIYGLICIPPAIGFIGGATSGDSDWLPFYLFLSASVLLAALALYYNYSLRRELRQSLKRSDLFLRIVMDGLADDPIFSALPDSLHFMLPRNKAADLLPALRRVSGNLDWYLAGGQGKLLPRRLPQVLVNFAAVALLLLFAAHAWLNLSVGGVPPNWLALLPWLAAATVQSFLQFRRQAWTEEFVRYLEACLEGG